MCQYGQYFCRCREERGLTQREMVQRLRDAGHKITLRRYIRLEANESVIHSNDLYFSAKVLNVTADSLVGR